MPNPPKPRELLKRQGTFRPDRHGSRTALAAVEPVEALPHESAPLDVFDAVMSQGVVWLGRTDAPALAMLRSLLEERGPLRESAMNGSTEARSQLRVLDKQIVSLLSDLGFNPAARSRLGLAEVKAKNKLEELRERQAKRGG